MQLQLDVPFHRQVCLLVLCLESCIWLHLKRSASRTLTSVPDGSPMLNGWKKGFMSLPSLSLDIIACLPLQDQREVHRQQLKQQEQAEAEAALRQEAEQKARGRAGADHSNIYDLGRMTP